jgi:hypothetical protein
MFELSAVLIKWSVQLSKVSTKNFIIWLNGTKGAWMQLP